MALIAQSIGEEVGLLHARTFVSVHQRPFTGFNPLPRTFGHLAFSESAILGIGQREQAERWNHTGHGHPIYQRWRQACAANPAVDIRAHSRRQRFSDA
jgi:hypothetical protein